MLKKISHAPTRVREELKEAIQQVSDAAERLRVACLPETPCPMLERGEDRPRRHLR